MNRVNLPCQIDAFFRSKNIRKEFYHGGKYNGVNCIRIMEQSNLLIDHICDEVVKNRDMTFDAWETEDTIRKRCEKYKELLSNLGTIWSTVRGIEKGLLPTDENKLQLHNAIRIGKNIWLELGITTYQPKWHYTFDGHLEEQYIRFGGLADKADDSIEYGHQIWPRLDDRYKCVPNFKKRTELVYRTAKRRRHPKIAEHLELFSKRKQSPSNKRFCASIQKQDEERDAKKSSLR